jgi:hypothetical protein
MSENLSMPNAPCWKKLLDLEVEALNAVVRPIAKANMVNQAVTANTNLIAATANQQSLSPTKGPCIFRIYVALSVSGIFSVQRQNQGPAVTENLNQGVALTAAAAYMFDILVDQGEKIDFQTTVSGIVLKLCVVEKDDAK